MIKIIGNTNVNAKYTKDSEDLEAEISKITKNSIRSVVEIIDEDISALNSIISNINNETANKNLNTSLNVIKDSIFNIKIIINTEENLSEADLTLAYSSITDLLNEISVLKDTAIKAIVDDKNLDRTIEEINTKIDQIDIRKLGVGSENHNIISYEDFVNIYANKNISESYITEEYKKKNFNLSYIMRNKSAESISLFIVGTPDMNENNTIREEITVEPNSIKHYSHNFNIGEFNSETFNFNIKTVATSSTDIEKIKQLEIKNVKLELGDIATDYGYNSKYFKDYAKEKADEVSFYGENLLSKSVFSTDTDNWSFWSKKAPYAKTHNINNTEDGVLLPPMEASFRYEIFTRQRVNRINDSKKYMLSFKITNPEPVTSGEFAVTIEDISGAVTKYLNAKNKNYLSLEIENDKEFTIGIANNSNVSMYINYIKLEPFSSKETGYSLSPEDTKQVISDISGIRKETEEIFESNQNEINDIKNKMPTDDDKNRWNKSTHQVYIKENHTILSNSFMLTNSADWALGISKDYFVAEISDNNITQSSVVDINIHPKNIEMSLDSGVQSYTVTENGKARIYFEEKPNENIDITYIVMKSGV